MHRQAGANCTEAKLYFWTIFQFFFMQMGPGSTHPLPNSFFIFGIFLTLQSPLLAFIMIYNTVILVTPVAAFGVCHLRLPLVLTNFG